MAVVGSAQVLIRPTFPGFQSEVKKALGEVGEPAGRTAGTKLGDSLKKWGKRGAAVAGGAIAGVAGAALVKGFGRLKSIENAEAKLRGLGHSAETVQNIMDNALAAVKGTAFGMDEAATAAASAVAAGVEPGKELEGYLKLVGDAATIAGTDMSAMGSIFGKVMTSGKVQGDVFKQLGDQGIPIVQMLAETLGVSAEEVYKLGSAGEITSADFLEAMSSVEGAALEGGNTTEGAFKNMGAALGRVGANFLSGVFPKFKDGFTGITDFLGPIEDKAKEVGEAISEWLGKAADKVGEFVQEFKDGEGAAGTFRNVLEKVWDAAKSLFNFIKDTAIPAAKSVYDWMVKQQNWLIPIAAGIGAIVAAWKTYQVVMGIVRGVTVAFTAVQGALNAVMSMNPIGLVVLALVGLVAAFVTAYKKSETFRKIVDAAWSGIKKAAAAVWAFLRDKVFTPIGNFLKGTGDKFTSMKTGIVDGWNTVKSKLKAGWEFVKKWALAPFKLQIEVLKTAFTTAVDGIKGSWDGIKNSFKKVWDWVKTNVLDRFSNGLTNLKDNVVNAVKLIGNGWKNIANKFRSPINWVLDKVWNKGIAKAFNNAASALNLKTRLTTEANIPAFAKGGYHKGGWALVGEEGPELVNFSKPGRVYTADQTAAALAGGDGKSPAAGGPVAMGGWWDKVKGVGSAIKDGIVDAASGAIKWVRGGLADAAAFLLKPIRGLIGSTVGQWGKVGGFAGDTMKYGMDKLVDWIGGKDEAEAPPIGGKGWVRPSVGPITSRYGPRSMFGNSFHAGIDIAGGGATYAAAGGRVFKTGWGILGGRTGIGIGIDHGGGTFTYYGHNPSMSAVRVSPGDAVKAGQRVGAQGATGNVTGTHVHFELHKGGWGKAVNPEQLGLFDQGGWLKPGHMALNLSNRPEPVLTGAQWDKIQAGQSGGTQYIAQISAQTGSGPSEIADAVLYGMRRMNRGGVYAR